MGLHDEVKKRLPEDKEADVVLDKLMKLGENKQKMDSAFRQGFMTFLKTLPLVFINLLGAVIIGLDNFVEGAWDWGIFITASFWYSYISYQMANWLIALTWFTNIIKRFKKNFPNYSENLAFIQTMVDKDHEDEFIEKQVLVERVKRKKETLELQVYRKIYLIREKHKIKSVDEFLSNGKIGIFESDKRWIFKWFDIKQKKKVYKAILELKEMLTLDWQKQFLMSYIIPYTHITRDLLVSGLSPRNRKGVYNDYKTRFASKTFIAIVPSAVATSILGLVLLSFQFLFKEATVYTWLKFAVQIILIVWNTFMIVMSAPEVFQSTHYSALEQRRSDLGLFRKRHENNNANEKDIITIING